MVDDETGIIDDTTAVRISPEFQAATIVAGDGSTHFVIVRIAALGDRDVAYDASCRLVSHEQLGPLPGEIINRIAHT